MTVSLWLTSQLEKEYGKYVGVDECGLGCWAGPVFAAAVVVDNTDWPEVDQLADSKTIGPRKRVALARRIKEECAWAIGRSEVEEIDTLGLRQAHALAIERAVAGLREQGVPTPCVVIDGDAFDVLLPAPVRFIRHGDQLIPAISAASIIAKVDRDAHMAELHLAEPQYGWDQNAAYGTEAHRQAMEKYGLSKHHRRSFKPVARIAVALGDISDSANEVVASFLANRDRRARSKRAGHRGRA